MPAPSGRSPQALAAAERNYPKVRRFFSFMKTIDTNPKVPRGRRGKKTANNEIHQATSKDFEREGMGLAPKE